MKHCALRLCRYLASDAVEIIVRDADEVVTTHFYCAFHAEWAEIAVSLAALSTNRQHLVYTTRREMTEQEKAS